MLRRERKLVTAGGFDVMRRVAGRYPTIDIVVECTRWRDIIVPLCAFNRVLFSVCVKISAIAVFNMESDNDNCINKPGTSSMPRSIMNIGTFTDIYSDRSIGTMDPPCMKKAKRMQFVNV
nr:uncharacterized protein LOC117219323 [Megalopta genalis]